jgi:hypothetical protein
MATRLLLVFAVLIAAALTLHPAGASAGQPPTYDYDAATDGVQGPTSPPDVSRRFWRTFQLGVTVLVPTSDLQRDRRTVQSAPAVHAKGNRIEIPGRGTVRVLDTGASFSFVRGQEIWVAFE